MLSRVYWPPTYYCPPYFLYVVVMVLCAIIRQSFQRSKTFMTFVTYNPRTLVSSAFMGE